MKKRVLSLALALVLSLGLAATALAEEVSSNAGTWVYEFEPVGESLDQPAPLPEHLADAANSDYWVIYDYDEADVLEVTRDEWGDKVYTVLEGTKFTIWPNPNWPGRVWSVMIIDDESCGHELYRIEPQDKITDMRSMAPLTITFDHAYPMPDGTVSDFAQLGATYFLCMEACNDSDGDGYDDDMGGVMGSNFCVIPAVAYASTQTVDIDGKAVEFQMYAIKDANGNDTNYVKVRDVALALDGTTAQFNVGYDGNVNLEKGQPYTTRNGQENNTPYSGDQPFTCATSTTNVDGEEADLTAFVITDATGGGNTYYKLRDLGSALGFTVDWSAQRGVYIETK